MSRGLIIGSAVGAGLFNRCEKLEFQLEVEVEETAGELSKIRIKEVYGASKYQVKQIKEEFPRWIPTTEIKSLEAKE